MSQLFASLPTYLFSAWLAATAFVAWPIVGKYSGIGGHWVNIVVLSGSTLAGIAMAYPQVRGEPLPSFRGLGVVLLAALANGAAVYLYSLKTSDPNVPTGSFIVTVTLMMVVMGFLLSVILTGQHATPRQLAGLALAVFAVWLIAG